MMAVRQYTDDFDQNDAELFQPAHLLHFDQFASGSSEEKRSSTSPKRVSIVDSILQNAAANLRGRKVLDGHHLYLETTRLDLAEASNGNTHHVFLSTAEKQIRLAPSTERVWVTNGNSTNRETVPASRSLVVHDFPDRRDGNDAYFNDQRLRLEKIVRRSHFSVYLRAKRRGITSRFTSSNRPQHYRGR